jgi:hypothetical protein
MQAAQAACRQSLNKLRLNEGAAMSLMVAGRSKGLG